MLLEKCVGKEIGGCGKCDGGRLALKDRMGAEFPVLREWKHRSLVFNSIHTSMSDKQELLVKNGATARHFIFSDESKEECERVVNAFKKGLPIDKRARRIGSAVPTKN
jgi:hypothetical protein